MEKSDLKVRVTNLTLSVTRGALKEKIERETLSADYEH